jgi:hypothetical protein
MTDVTKHAEAMRTVAAALKPFPPEDRLVMLCGELGHVLCELGDEPSQHSAIAMMGSAFAMVLGMIKQIFSKEHFDA